jgi:hypothetical protein
MSFRLGVGGCGAMVATGPVGQPNSCRLPVTRCRLLLHRPKNKPAETWLVFACEAHASGLAARGSCSTATGPCSTSGERRQLARRRGSCGGGRSRSREAGDAVQLVELARRWAER